jgi:hypothetical protein
MKKSNYVFSISLIFSIILAINIFPASISAKAPINDFQRIGTILPPESGSIQSDMSPASDSRIYPTNGAVDIPTNLTFRWGPITGANGYDFRLSADSSFSDTIFSQDGLTESTCTVQNLKPLTGYYWEVRAFSKSVVGNWTPPTTFTTFGNATTTNLVSSANPSMVGSAIALSAIVGDRSGTGTPNGTVAFKEGEKSLGEVTLNSGTATLLVSKLSPGNHVLTAVYSGFSIWVGSTSNVHTQIVNGYATTTILTSVNPSINGQSVILTATVKESSGKGTPSGEVIFKMNGETIDTVTMSSGKANLTTSALESGSYTFSAIYIGSGDYADSQSSDLTQVVKKTVALTNIIINGNTQFALFIIIGLICLVLGILNLVISNRIALKTHHFISSTQLYLRIAGILITLASLFWITGVIAGYL